MELRECIAESLKLVFLKLCSSSFLLSAHYLKLKMFVTAGTRVVFCAWIACSQNNYKQSTQDIRLTASSVGTRAVSLEIRKLNNWLSSCNHKSGNRGSRGSAGS